MNTQQVVPFYDNEIITITEDARHFVAIKPICETFGIAWNAQFERLNRDDLFNSTIRTLRTLGADKKQREMVCLPMEYFPIWLAKISTVNIKNEHAKAVILTYQKEVARVLYFHFFGNPIALREEKDKLKDQLIETQGKAIYAMEMRMKRNNRQVVTPAMRKKIVEYRDGGKTWAWIGRKIGITQTTALLHYKFAMNEKDSQDAK